MPPSDAPRPSTVTPKPLSALAARLGLRHAVRGAVSGIAHDSRMVVPGDLYVAVPGRHRHGADFAGQAVGSGAAAVLTDEDGRRRAGDLPVPVLVVADPRTVMGDVAAWIYGDPARDLLLLGVTGTSGKTTCAYLLEGGLRAAGHRTGLVGTVETKVAGRSVKSTLTTPEATDLHALFAVMREASVTAAAMEVSSHALALSRVAGAVFDVALFTNLSQDHLDFHADLEDYFAAKARLFTPEYSRVAVVNVDDPYGQRLAAETTLPVTTFSAGSSAGSSADGSPAADWRAVDVRSGLDGSTFRIVGPGGVEADGSVQIPGPFNVANALGAVVTLVEAGESLQSAVTGVASIPGVPGRMERVDAGQRFLAVVDYSHKPAAVEAVLHALRSVSHGRLIVVLGCGGDRDRQKRPMMGAAAAGLADLAVFTNDNPRFEDPLAILQAMMDGAVSVPAEHRAHVVVEPDRNRAIETAVSRASPGDVVVVAGKGHEQGQEAGGVVYPFDDRAVLAEALERWVKSGGRA